MQHFCVCDWLVYLGSCPQGLFMLYHILSEFPSFLRLRIFIVCLDCALFIHWSVNGRLGCFCILVAVNNAALNMAIPTTLGKPCSQFSWVYTQVKLLQPVVILFICWGPTILFSIVAAPFYVSTKSVQVCQFLCIFTSTCCFLLFWLLTILMGVRSYHTVLHWGTRQIVRTFHVFMSNISPFMFLLKC